MFRYLQLICLLLPLCNCRLLSHYRFADMQGGSFQSPKGSKEQLFKSIVTASLLYTANAYAPCPPNAKTCEFEKPHTSNKPYFASFDMNNQNMPGVDNTYSQIFNKAHAVNKATEKNHDNMVKLAEHGDEIAETMVEVMNKYDDDLESKEAQDELARKLQAIVAGAGVVSGAAAVVGGMAILEITANTIGRLINAGIHSSTETDRYLKGKGLSGTDFDQLSSDDKAALIAHGMVGFAGGFFQPMGFSHALFNQGSSKSALNANRLQRLEEDLLYVDYLRRNYRQEQQMKRWH